MKNVFLLIAAIITLQSYSQQKHFSLSMDLRTQSDSIFCDLIANDDYPIQSLQFGFNHNSDNVNFLAVQAVALPDVNQLAFNQICPKFVRMLWTPKTEPFHLIKKGDVLFSLIYKQLNPTDHFICMMPSSGAPGGECTNFLREVTDDVFKTYIVDDVCINYKIDHGQALILSSNNQNADQISVCQNGQCNGLIINNDAGFSMKNAILQIINVNGATCYSQSLQFTTITQNIDLSKLPIGFYVYRIVSEKTSLKSGKIVLR